MRHKRETTATEAVGAKLDAIGGMLGHASVTTTQVYAKIVDQEHRFYVCGGGFGRVFGNEEALNHSLQTSAPAPTRLSSQNRCS